MEISFKMDKELLDEVNAATSNLWLPPADAIRKGDTASWSDLVAVTGVDIGPDNNVPERYVMRVDFVVPPDAPPYESEEFNARVGRVHSEFYRTNPTALRDPGHKDRKMTVLSLSAITTLCRAAQLLVEGDTETDAVDFFLPHGDEPPMIVGRRVVARVRQYKDKNGIARQELGRFVAEGL
jgi:hypothetical protein